eukprot:TRINITY_DN3676_c0_g1_i1.p1 TRINITY_DN3676_c0_g1~~TRINITY_DN3676_c0_g1_i1.p1  ORF type:complete len:322 (-),score=31.74 TRINITY_DN3676_c0_g1_i1:282-1190(-)
MKIISFLWLFYVFVSVEAQSKGNDTDEDEAVILQAKDLTNETRQALLNAVVGLPSYGEGGNSYLVVPANATVIIIEPQNSPSNMTTIPVSKPSPKPSFSQSSPGSNRPPCRDTPPDKDYTCAQQAKFGQCNADFMLEGNYCAASCGRCKSQGQQESSQGCMPLSTLLLTRNDTQSFRDALAITNLEDLVRDDSYQATVLIPNDAAFFAALQAFGAESPRLTRLSLVHELIEGHIIPNMAVESDQLVDGQPLIPLSGEGFWQVESSEESVVIEGSVLGPATLIESNIVACSIVAHIVDTVLAF